MISFFKRKKIIECYCKVIDSRNPHKWVRGYCPPTPMPKDRKG